ncbi:MAG: hypothetical protein MJZ15_08905 [Bacteroidales bacterium]|nr:hypothetical protein [Bacteroidales bacterium]
MTKSTTRKELALAAGVSTKTINRWLARIMPQLIALGYRKGDKLFNPTTTALICRHFDIELKQN